MHAQNELHIVLRGRGPHNFVVGEIEEFIGCQPMLNALQVGGCQSSFEDLRFLCGLALPVILAVGADQDAYVFVTARVHQTHEVAGWGGSAVLAVSPGHDPQGENRNERRKASAHDGEF